MFIWFVFIIYLNIYSTQTTPDIETEVFNSVGFKILFENEVIAYEKILQTLGWVDSFPK